MLIHSITCKNQWQNKQLRMRNTPLGKQQRLTRSAEMSDGGANRPWLIFCVCLFPWQTVTHLLCLSLSLTDRDSSFVSVSFPWQTTTHLLCLPLSLTDYDSSFVSASFPDRPWFFFCVSLFPWQNMTLLLCLPLSPTDRDPSFVSASFPDRPWPFFCVCLFPRQTVTLLLCPSHSPTDRDSSFVSVSFPNWPWLIFSVSPYCKHATFFVCVSYSHKSSLIFFVCPFLSQIVTHFCMCYFLLQPDSLFVCVPFQPQTMTHLLCVLFSQCWCHCDKDGTGRWPLSAELSRRPPAQPCLPETTAAHGGIEPAAPHLRDVEYPPGRVSGLPC